MPIDMFFTFYSNQCSLTVFVKTLFERGSFWNNLCFGGEFKLSQFVRTLKFNLKEKRAEGISRFVQLKYSV